MIVPHHTNMDSSLGAGVVHADGRPVWCALRWPPATPLLAQGLRLLEIVQQRGAFESEAPDPDWRVAWGGFGGSAQTALLRGHRIGFHPAPTTTRMALARTARRLRRAHRRPGARA